jgi:MerR family transcriptional regulator, copper efflux regulator
VASAERAREMNRGIVSDGELMTVGALSRRTGLTIKAIREYEGLGLIYSAGRSEGGYRLFDRSALWCAEVISTLRSVGVTVKEIAELGNAYLRRPDDPLGPQVAALLDRAERRTERRITELSVLLGRLREYRQRHAAALAGDLGAELFGEDPRQGVDGT